MKKSLLILIALCITTICYSQIVKNYTTYTLTFTVTSMSPNTVAVTAYNYIATGGTDVVIPISITDASEVYTVTSIGPVTFINKQLTSVIIPNSIISIGNAAFRINQLTSVTIPDSVISLGSGAFVSNPIVNLDLGNTIETIGNSAFGSNALTTVVIPDSVTSIGSNVFTNNQLTSVTLGNSIMSIGNSAFSGNPLNTVISNAIIPPTITTGGSTDTFGNRSGVDLTIPNGTTGVYVTDVGALWTGFNSIVLSNSNFELVNGITVIITTDKIEVRSFNNVRLQNYTIYSTSGATMATDNKSEILTTYLASGIYILKLDFDKGIVTKKIIIN